MDMCRDCFIQDINPSCRETRSQDRGGEAEKIFGENNDKKYEDTEVSVSVDKDTAGLGRTYSDPRWMDCPAQTYSHLGQKGLF